MSGAYVPDDDQAFLQARAGDADAFRRLYERYKKLAFGRAWTVAMAGLAREFGETTKTATQKARDIAEDAVQETFTVAWNKIDDIDDATYFRRWLLVVATNRAKNELRLLRRKKRRVVTANTHLLEQASAPTQNPEGLVVDWELSEVADDLLKRMVALAGISDRDLDVIMRRAKGEKPAEIAREMGLTVSNVNVIAMRTRKRLWSAYVALRGEANDA